MEKDQPASAEEILMGLRSEGCPSDERVCEGAAERGDLDMVECAHENGCPWDERTCEEAAAEGHLDVLKYTRENGCDWGWRVSYYAVMPNDMDMLQSAYKKGCCPYHTANQATRKALEWSGLSFSLPV